MKQRYQLIKDEIMYLISLSPEAMHSIGGLHDRLKDKVTRVEIDRAVACLLSRQHIKKLGAYVFGLGTGDGITPYPLDDYQADALTASNQPAASNKHKIAAAEQKRQQQIGNKKTLQAGSGGEKAIQDAPQPEIAGIKETAPNIPAPEEKAAQAKPAEYEAPAFVVNFPAVRQANINQKLEQLRDRLGARHIQDMPIKINVLEQLADAIGDPDIANVLTQIKHDLKGVVNV